MRCRTVLTVIHAVLILVTTVVLLTLERSVTVRVMKTDTPDNTAAQNAAYMDRVVRIASNHADVTRLMELKEMMDKELCSRDATHRVPTPADIDAATRGTALERTTALLRLTGILKGDVEALERVSAEALGTTGTVQLPNAPAEVLNALRLEGVYLEDMPRGDPPLRQALLPKDWRIVQVGHNPCTRELRRADGSAVASIYYRFNGYDNMSTMHLIKPTPAE